MTLRINRLATSLVLLGFISTPVGAEDTTSEVQMRHLEQQVNVLQAELAAIKSQMHASHVKRKKHHTPVKTTTTTTTVASQGLAPDAAAHLPSGYIPPSEAYPIDIDVPGRAFVSSGPYIGVPFAFSGGDLIINSPSVNQDVALLNIRKAIHQRLLALGHGNLEDHAHLLLSGIVEGQASYHRPGQGAAETDINLSGAELDGYILGPSGWTSGLIAFSYDDASRPSEGSLNNNSPTQNSRVHISKAFITIGDFSKTPLYGSIGQFYVPFGTYSSNMITSPVTKILGRTRARSIVVGYQQQTDNAFYAAGYVFKGDTHAGSTARVNNGGVNLGYRYMVGPLHGDFGGGVIANIADSVGMQSNSNAAPQFGGFGAVGNGLETISHRVPAMNLRGLFSIGDHTDLLAEYIGALNSFSRYDMTMNTHGAKPQALNAEAAYTFSAFDRPSAFVLGYGKTRDALALGLPSTRYTVELNTSWWKDTLQSLELRHDINYSAGNFASGSGPLVTQVIQGSGRSDNTITAQMDIYF